MYLPDSVEESSSDESSCGSDVGTEVDFESESGDDDSDSDSISDQEIRVFGTYSGDKEFFRDTFPGPAWRHAWESADPFNMEDLEDYEQVRNALNFLIHSII